MENAAVGDTAPTATTTGGIFPCIYVHMNVGMYVCMYVCMYVHKYEYIAMMSVCTFLSAFCRRKATEQGSCRNSLGT